MTLTKKEESRIATLENQYGIMRGKVDKTVKNFKKLRRAFFNETASKGGTVDRNVLRRIELNEADIDSLNDSLRFFTEQEEEQEEKNTAENAEVIIKKTKPEKPREIEKLDFTKISKIGSISKG